MLPPAAARIFSFGLAIALGANCVGAIADPDGTSQGGDGPATAGRSSPGSSTPGGSGSAGLEPSAGQEGAGQPGSLPPGSFAPAPGGLMRLTASQYHNTLRDLLGVTGARAVAPDQRGSIFSSIGAFEVSTAQVDVERYEKAAFAVAREVFGDEAKRRALVGCAPSSASDPCVRAFVSAFGRRAFRRPLEPAEVDRYALVVSKSAAALGDVWGGLEHGLAALLQAPDFLYVPLLGKPDPADRTRQRLDGFELASRLSFFLWDSTPDDAMLDAAAKGELDSPAGLRAVIGRMVASPKTRDAVARFFAEHFGLDDFLEEAAKDSKIYPQATPALLEAMLGELRGILEQAIFSPQADFMDAFETKTAFVNPELAKLYGLEPPAGGAMAERALPEDSPRVGLLSRAALLALKARPIRSSPTLRGVFVREQILCQEVPPPPDDAETELPGDADGILPEDGKAMRERLADHSKKPECAACHALFDPLGLAFENFDGLGAYRTTENGQRIDPSGTLDGKPFSGPRELAALLRSDRRTADCVARQVFRFGTGRLEEGSQEPQVAALSEAFQKNRRSFVALLSELAASDGFRFVAASP
jgi:hypothetical protein